jgi:hypothetical protein
MFSRKVASCKSFRDVYVYDFEGAEMYRMPRIYLARARENIHIEFPQTT